MGSPTKKLEIGVQYPRERLHIREADTHHWVTCTKKKVKNEETQSPEMDSRGPLICKSQAKNIWPRNSCKSIRQKDNLIEMGKRLGQSLPKGPIYK